MRISVIQSSQKVLYDANHPGPFDYETCMRLSRQVVGQTFELMEAAAKAGTDFIVTMEALNVSVFPDDFRYRFVDTVPELDDELFRKFSRFSERHGVYTVGGLYNRRQGKAYNSGILFGPTGRIEGIYDKVHLAGGEKAGLTPGNSFPVFDTKFGKVGILVCWDMQFPEAARELVLAGADLIACPTWGWENIYGLSRAYENDVCLAAAMAIPPNGKIEGIRSPSCIVDGQGNILVQCPRDRATFATAEIDIRKHTASGNGKAMRDIRLSDRRPDTYQLIRATRFQAHLYHSRTN